MVSEKDARRGKFVLFTSPKVEVRIRTLAETEAWLDDADEVDKLAAKAKDREGQKAYNMALYDCVFGYDADLDRAELESLFTAAQVLDAFERLRCELDPFFARKKKQEQERSKQLGEANLILGSLSPDAQKIALNLIREGKLSL